MQNVLDNRFLELPKSALIASLIVHLSIPFFVLTVQVLDKMGISIFPKKTAQKELFQQFIQVDVVDLPDNLFKDKGMVDSTLPIVEKPKVLPEVAKKIHEKDIIEERAPEEKKLTKAERRRLEMQEAKAKEQQRKKELEAALKTAMAEANRERALKDLVAKSGKAGRSKVAGNILSKGTATTGAIGTAKDQYTALIVEAIRQHFHIYPWQQKKGLVGNIKIELFPTGRLRSRKILKPSGDAVFDSALIQAVDAAQPFPMPEDPDILGSDFEITFIP